MNQVKNLNLPSILIIDDNVKNLQVLGGFLQMEGLIVEFALDGISALNWLKKKKFDLILLDVIMPDMDGYEVCSIIKKNPALTEIPIIFITANTDSESIIKGFNTGAVDYITKPFMQSELLVRVKTQLNISRSKEQISLYLNEIEEQNKDINDSIDYARHIQNAVLLSSEKNLSYLQEHFILYLPKDILSGDFYWICKVDTKLIVAVMDCTGHGVPGALMSILGITFLNEIVLQNHIIQPDKILESLRLKIIIALGQEKGNDHVKDGMEGSIICIDTDSDKLMYSGAFNPLILIREDEIFVIKADDIPIGYFEIKGNYSLHEIDIKNNDAIYMFSDGIIDQFGGPFNKRFMLKHLKEIIFANHNLTMIRQKEILLDELKRWKGELLQTDDILFLGIRL